MRRYFVYLLTNYNNNILYTGVTNNLSRRIYEHKKHHIQGFTSKYNVTKLVYFEEFNTPLEAISAEKRIKGWKREKKNKLIQTQNPNWYDLGKDL